MRLDNFPYTCGCAVMQVCLDRP